jgi:TetR/AcrR family transcriptional regulator, transcriptional repressor for nem operon
MRRPATPRWMFSPESTKTMPRVSRSEAQANRMRVAQTASRMYREGGIERVSVAEVMAAAGMTVGAFHAQFGSKDALAVEACNHAFGQSNHDWRQRIQDAGADPKLLMRLVESYLCVEHRDNPGVGCPTAALSSDVTHEPAGSPLRHAYLSGIKQFSSILSGIMPISFSKKKRRQRALALYATLVGAITIARATDQDPISDEILVAAIGAMKELCRI